MAEKAAKALHRRPTTWYGLSADITVASNHWHRVVVLGLPLPHPGLVNLFARWGLPVDERLALTSRHELGHLQMLLLPLLHLLFILWPRPGQGSVPRWRRALVGFVAHQSVWELAAESYVVVGARRDRCRVCSGAGRTIYAILWSGMAFLAVAATALVVRRHNP